MDDIGGDGNQLQGKELYKHQFQQDFTARLNSIMGFDDAVSGDQVFDTLACLTMKAIYHGGIYIAEDEPVYDRRDSIGVAPNRIAQKRSFMELLRECEPDSIDGIALREIEDQATLVGRNISKYLIHMMVVMNIDNQQDLMQYFRNTVTLFSFLADAFEWPGRNVEFGVVFNRIDVLVKHAHKEFILQVKTTRMAGGSYLQSLGLRFDNISKRDELLDDLLLRLHHAISMLECLLSFPLLPDRPQLLKTKRRSVIWLHAAVVGVGECLLLKVGNLQKLMNEQFTENTVFRSKNFDDVYAFYDRGVDSPNNELWQKLGTKLEVMASKFVGRIRLHAEGRIIHQYKNIGLIQIRGINSIMEAEWYIGKSVAYFYRTKMKRNRSHYRCIWGTVTRPHEVRGILYVRFNNTLRRMRARLRKLWVRLYMYGTRDFQMFGGIHPHD